MWFVLRYSINIWGIFIKEIPRKGRYTVVPTVLFVLNLQLLYEYSDFIRLLLSAVPF